MPVEESQQLFINEAPKLLIVLHPKCRMESKSFGYFPLTGLGKPVLHMEPQILTLCRDLLRVPREVRHRY